MVTCNNLSVKYEDDYGIKNLNLAIEAGSTCAIIGKSGCGKTTLLHCIAGLLQPFEGHVEVGPVDEGLDIKGGNRTGIILQDDGLFPWKSVYDNIALGLVIQGYNCQSIDDRVTSLLKELDIQEQRHKFPANISGGQRKRAAIARALALEPELLLMDEPTGSLDSITKEAFQDQILSLYKQRRMSMMVVTHDIEEAAFLGQRIIVMKEGRIVADIENPLFMNEHIREDLSFYEFTLKIRKVLEQ